MGHRSKPLVAIFANMEHVATAVGLDNTVMLKKHFNAFKVVRQITKVALRSFALLVRFGHLNCA